MLTLQHLTLAECSHRADDVRHQIVLCALHTEAHRASQQVVAKHHGVARLPQGIDRGTATTLIGVVDNVVVNE